MTITIRRAALVGLLAMTPLAVAGSASAVTVHPTDGTAPFLGATSAAEDLVVKGGAGVAKSTSATYNGSTTTPLSDGRAQVNPVWSGTTSKMAGIIYPAAVSFAGP